MKIETFDAGTPLVTSLSTALDNMLLTSGEDVATFVSAVCQVEDTELRTILIKLADCWINNYSDQPEEVELVCESISEYENANL